MKIFHQEHARLYLPNIIQDDCATLVTPVIDTVQTNNKIGHLIIYKNMSIDVNDKMIKGKPFTASQSKIFEGSFLLYATNINMVNHLFNMFVLGKYNENSDIILDKGYDAAYSAEFKNIIRYYITLCKGVF